MTAIAHSTGVRVRTADAHLAADPAATRDFACLAEVTHLRPGDPANLRRIAGIIGVIETETEADLHLIVEGSSRRGAQREVVARIAAAVPHAVVTVPEVVDYDAALLSFLERHGDDHDDLAFDDREAVAEILDRGV